MNSTNEQRVTRKALGKLLALGLVAGVYCVATVGASGLITAATDMSAQAKGHGGHGHGGHAGGHGHGHGHGGHAGGHGYGGGHFYGRGRGHYWHGHWYGYGVGSCWRLTPVGYVWICG